MTPREIRGCDVSTFQPPGLVDWTRQDFGIVRATYGSRHDTKTAQHAERIRGAGIPLGLYHFLLPQTAADKQVDAFCKQADAVKLGTGDLLPAIDVEAYPNRFDGSKPTHFAQVDKTWADEDSDALCQIVEVFDRDFGGCILYLTQRDWALLGKPAWVLDRPLWVAHYPKTGSTSPLARAATPGGKPWRIWQCMVGPLDQKLQAPNDPKAVDQNVATDPLPLIGAPKVEPVEQIPWLPIELTEEDYAEMRASRDARLRELFEK